MSSTADAVVIGGGILGVSTAHFLARLGFGSVVLLEKRTLAAVSTGHSAAAIRTFYSNPLTIRLAVRSAGMFADAQEVFGGSCGFRQTGYLTLLDEDAWTAAGRWPTWNASWACPWRNSPSRRCGTASPWSTWSRCGPASSSRAPGTPTPWPPRGCWRRAAGSWGLTVREGVGATGILMEGGRVAGVETDEGPISTPVVVNAAGGWGRVVASWVGLNYSFRWSRESDIVLEVPFETEGFPWLSDPRLRFYARPAGPRQLLAGLGFPKEIEPLDIDRYDPEIDAPTRQRIEDLLGRRVPAARGGTFVRGWASMYTITDDWHPLVGPEPEVPGYYACVAGNGHCFKLGPSIGESLAQVIAGQEPEVDLHPLRPNRFHEGDYFTSVWGGGNRA